MAAAAAPDEAEWEIKCAYCFSAEAEMDNPRRLPCGHVNCLKGIEYDMAANDNTLRCTKCRKVYDITTSELEAHQPGSNIVSQQLCEACSHVSAMTPAKIYCMTCPSKMCENHEKQHEELLPMHTNMVSIADYILQQRKLIPRYCPKHKNQTLTLACNKCLHTFCTDCEDLSSPCDIGNTTCHVISSTKKISELLQDKLKKLKSESMVKGESILDFAEGCAQNLEVYDKETETMTAAIEWTQKEQIETLTQKYSALKEAFTSQRQMKRAEMAMFLKTNVDDHHKELYNNIQVLESTIADLHEVDLIESFGRRKATIERLISKPIPYLKAFHGITKLKPCEEEHREVELDLDNSEELKLWERTNSSDPLRSEATFQYKIENISKMKDMLYSPAHMVRNLPWKILAMVRTQSKGFGSMKTLGFFLQCNAESDSMLWSCDASAELRMLKQTDASGETDPYHRRIQHLFFSKENDFGFSNFLTWNDMTDPSKGYIKDDSIILEVFVTADAPRGVRQDEAQLKEDRSEAHLYMYINVVLEDVFLSHHGLDLFDANKSMYALRKFRQKRADTISQLLETLAEALNYKPGQIRIWPFQMRQNQTFRPTMLEIPVAEYSRNTIQEASDGEAPWYIFVETLPIGSPLEALPHFDRTGHICLFIKRYDPKSETLTYCGQHNFPLTIVMDDMMPILAEIAGFPVGTKLAMYEEVKPNLIEKVEFTGGVLGPELIDGDIIIVQKEESSLEGYKKPTPKEYFSELLNQVVVMFYDKNNPTDAGFTLDLSPSMNYNTIATQVAEHLGCDQRMLQFFRRQRYLKGPGDAINCTFDGLLKDLLSANRSRRKRGNLYYQKLSLPLTEQESSD